MTRIRAILVLVGTLTLAARAAGEARSFTQSLSAEQKHRLGLERLTAEQIRELDAAVAAYTHGESSAAIQQAVQQAEEQAQEKVQQAEKKAAEKAVADYKKKKEPGVIARTLQRFERRQEEERRERFTAHVVGEFRGWQGETYFPLDNGQVWRQVGFENDEMPPVQNAEVEIYRSANGYWRLRYDGAWITVKRLQ